MHEKYGKFVRFGPNSLSVNSDTALHEIYGHRANVKKAEFYDAFVHPAPNTHNARDKDLHARKRRVLSHAFSDGAIKEVEKYILANIRTFCEAIGDYGRVIPDNKGWSSPKNMSDWSSWLAMDILGDLCFGKAFHMLERPDNRYTVDLVGVAAQRHLLVSLTNPSALARSAVLTVPSAAPCQSLISSASTRYSSTRSPLVDQSTWPIAASNSPNALPSGRRLTVATFSTTS